MNSELLFELTILILLIIIARILYLIHKITTGHSRINSKRTKPATTMICIGSGGHTTEMMNLVKNLDTLKYQPRHYVLAKSDATSLKHIKTMEAERQDFHKVHFIPRSRSVHQLYITSVFTTIYAILKSIPLVVRIKPDLILCNGPGTCIPICVIAFIMKVMFLCDTKIVFVESFCRTKTFSLSGKILIYLADNIIVQWPSLAKKLKRAEYIGQLL